MFRPRVIPVLLLKDNGLVKTTNFNNPKYIGDPINAVKIFNDLEADELIFLDITATNNQRTISHELVRDIGDEAFMPFAVGGGINSLDQVKQLINSGSEKVVLNTAAFVKQNLISEVAKIFGSQAVVVAIDVKKDFFAKKRVYIKCGKQKLSVPPVDWAKISEENGAGEILINSIDNDGTMQGYDLELIQEISASVKIPVIACGGAGNLSDFQQVIQQTNASAVAAGSMFVYHGPRRAVLINYPSREEIKNLFA